jgi:hypothetical protein
MAIGGSGSGIVAAARMAYLFGKDPADADRRVLCVVKHNVRDRPDELEFEIDTQYQSKIDSDVPFLIMGQETTFDISKLIANEKGKRGRPADKKAQAAEWLTKYLYNAGKPIVANKIYEDAKQFGMNSKTLAAAAKDMQVVKVPPGGGRSCTWQLSDEMQALAQATFEQDARDEIKGVAPPDEVVTITDDALEALWQAPTTADQLPSTEEPKDGDGQATA